MPPASRVTVVALVVHSYLRRSQGVWKAMMLRAKGWSMNNDVISLPFRLDKCSHCTLFVGRLAPISSRRLHTV